MPRTAVIFYKESDGSVPVLDWLDGLPDKAQDRFTALIELLGEKGYDLRRPLCDYLDSSVYELRAHVRTVQYRILYSFVGRNIVLLSHGCTKEKKVEKKDIRQAVLNLAQYNQDPEGHTHKE